MSLQVIKPGIYSLLQDGGRFGHQGMGITTGGPVDASAFYWANLLCENPRDSACIEVTTGGLILASTVKTSLAVTGATVSLRINNKSAELWQSHNINPGDRIELGFVSSGTRAYLAVAGGFKVEPVFNSVATVTREKLGGLSGEGSPLKAGDLLPCESVEDFQLWRLPESLRTDYSQNSALLRVILGYQQEAFSEAQKQLFFSSEYRVTQNCDRMGYRLQGASITPAIDSMLSEGICLGAIQFPADGQPIVLLNDRQTMGGYPKIGSVLSLDIGRLGQLRAGGTVRFEPISIDQAQSLLADSKKQFEAGPDTLVKIRN
ncbi:MAG: biotin-dependent carboxyltransferase family protein [Porticoccaceae bacterium]